MENFLEKVVSGVLKQRIFVLVAAGALFLYGIYATLNSSVDILPDLNRPTVTIFTEAEGYATEEVELLVTTPIEAVMNGANNVERVRSISSAGLSLVFVEFDWGADIYLARQIVAEKLNTVQTPDGTNSVLGPISSIMGEIRLIGLTSEDESVSNGDLRSQADWLVRPKLLTIPGIAQVTVIGGDRQEYSIEIDPTRMASKGIRLDSLLDILEGVVENTSGNYLITETQETPIRVIARTTNLDELRSIIIQQSAGLQVRLEDIATIQKSSSINPRGSAGVNGLPAVIMSIQKQPGQNTLELGERVDEALNDLQASLGNNITLHTQLFTQEKFIRNGVDNVSTAIRDAAILVFIILILFLGNWRALFVTLTALPFSFVLAILVMKYFGIELNVMTLGGLAVAIGELTDDAVVDVENSLRWIRNNAQKSDSDPTKKGLAEVILGSSREIRGSVIYSTILVGLVFLPLLGLDGIEGRLMEPLAYAYMIALLSSTIIALTVTVIMSYFLFRDKKISREDQPTWLVRCIHTLARPIISMSIRLPIIGALLAVTGIIGTTYLGIQAGKEFLPEFNEGTLTLGVSLPPGSSLDASNSKSVLIENALMTVDAVISVARRSGRAEEDEHANGVQISELEVDIEAGVNKDLVIAEIKDVISHLNLGEANVTIGQPISHRIEHILSGVRAPLVIKVFGQDLDVLRTIAIDIRNELERIPGTLEPVVQQEVPISEIHIIPDRLKLAQYGIHMSEFSRMVEGLMSGIEVGEILEGNRSFPLTLRIPSGSVESTKDILRLTFATEDSRILTVGQVADVQETFGRNTISHDNGQRRIVVSSGILDGDSVTIINTLKERVNNLDIPTGYFVSYEGTYKSQQESSRRLILLSLIALLGIIVALFFKFKKVSLVFQVLFNIPVTFFGGMLAIYLTGNVINLASMIGLISLLGLASRNGILLIEHWLHLMEKEDKPFTKQTIIEGSLNRLTPMLMTSLTSMLALLPLILGGESPGKEMLYPLSVVVFGGLIVSTIVEVFVRPGLFWWFERPRKRAS